MRPSKWLVFIRPSLAGFDRPLTTPASNLVRYAPSGFQYACLRVSGKLFWKSLKTAHKWFDLVVCGLLGLIRFDRL